MTSNVGADVIQRYMDNLPDLSGNASADADALARRRAMLSDCRREVVDILKQTVRPEFLNRIDEIIMFEPLSRKDVREILHLQMEDLRRKLSENGVDVRFTAEFEDYMTEKGYEPAYGARPIKRLMQKELVHLLAKEILDGRIHRDSVIEVSASDGGIVLRNV